MKEDLAGGRLPSGKFGANAAWWATGVNLNSALKQLALGKEWVSKRLKAIRFGVINVAGRITRHARQLTIRAEAIPRTSCWCSENTGAGSRTAADLTKPHNPATLQATQPRSLAALCPTLGEIVGPAPLTRPTLTESRLRLLVDHPSRTFHSPQSLSTHSGGGFGVTVTVWFTFQF